jgi:hypothetical protein
MMGSGSSEMSRSTRKKANSEARCTRSAEPCLVTMQDYQEGIKATNQVKKEEETPG